MVSQARLQSSPDQTLLKTLSYFHRYQYPLTPQEVWYWQHYSVHPLKQLRKWPYATGDFLHLENASGIVAKRIKKAMYSHNKWIIAEKQALLISHIPTVSAVFVTGSLAMNNSPRHDDIDLLIISQKHTLWLTRLLVVILLSLQSARRPSRLLLHSSPRVSDKICDNLYLDTRHLKLPHNPAVNVDNLFLSHEILQAKCLFDRGGINQKFLSDNSWIRYYLPIAYQQSVKSFYPRQTVSGDNNPPLNIFLFVINCFLFILQYLYMRPRLTRERIGLGYAFFHPRGYAMIKPLYG